MIDLRDLEDHKRTMNAGDAERRVTGPTSARKEEEMTDTEETEIDMTVEEEDDTVQAHLTQDQDTNEEDETTPMKTEAEDEEEDTQAQVQTLKKESDTEMTPEIEEENEILLIENLQLETALMIEIPLEKRQEEMIHLPEEEIHLPEEEIQMKDLQEEETLLPNSLQEDTPLKTDDKDQIQLTWMIMLKIKDLRLI